MEYIVATFMFSILPCFPLFTRPYFLPCVLFLSYFLSSFPFGVPPVFLFVSRLFSSFAAVADAVGTMAGEPGKGTTSKRHDRLVVSSNLSGPSAPPAPSSQQQQQQQQKEKGKEVESPVAPTMSLQELGLHDSDSPANQVDSAEKKKKEEEERIRREKEEEEQKRKDEERKRKEELERERERERIRVAELERERAEVQRAKERAAEKEKALNEAASAAAAVSFADSPQTAAAPPPLVPSPSTNKRVKALYDYNEPGENTLTMMAGDSAWYFCFPLFCFVFIFVSCFF